MRNSKLHSVLKKFDKYEQNRCRKYIQSPYFNRSEKIAELYEFFIEKVNEGEEEEEFSKESIWEALHSETELNSDRWRKYCSDLLKLIQGYLVQEEFEKDKPIQDCYLMQAVKDKELDIISSSIVKKSENNLKKYAYQNSDYYHSSYLMEKNKYQLIQFDKQRAAASNIESILKSLDIFYLSEKLRYYCNVLSRQSTVSHEYEIKLIQEIINHVKDKDYSNYPSVMIYYQIALALTDEANEDHYYKLKDLLKEHAIVFPKSEASDMYSFVVNYCTRKLNSGNNGYWREYYDVHQELLESKILIRDEELSPAIFKNIVAAGLRLGEVTSTEKFISDYSGFLPENQRENAVTYNTALLYLHQKMYDKVIQLLQEVEYEDFIYNLSAKRLLLMTYYETDEQEPLHSLIDSWRAYLYRQKSISSNFKISYSNLLKFTKRLLKIKYGDKSQLEVLKSEINSNQVASRSWLLEKITELE